MCYSLMCTDVNITLPYRLLGNVVPRQSQNMNIIYSKSRIKSKSTKRCLHFNLTECAEGWKTMLKAKKTTTNIYIYIIVIFQSLHRHSITGPMGQIESDNVNFTVIHIFVVFFGRRKITIMTKLSETFENEKYIQ